MDRGEFQQDSVLKQLEVLKEEEKEFQNLKVRRAPLRLTARPGFQASALMTPAPDSGKPQQQIGRERPELALGTSPLSKVGITPSPHKEMRELTSLPITFIMNFHVLD